MKRSNRMKPVLNIASRNQETALTELAKKQKVLTECEEKLASMRSWRNDYSAQDGQTKITASQLRDKQNFILQMDEAIAMLEKQLVDLNKQHKLSWQEWMKAKQKTEAIGIVIDNYKTSEHRYEMLKQEREIDDHYGKRKIR